jgi:hypothetical protein
MNVSSYDLSQLTLGFLSLAREEHLLFIMYLSELPHFLNVFANMKNLSSQLNVFEVSVVIYFSIS